ncbi:hypothetical protein PCASD_25228 [Puccinia coronata f. sp. avenae]|uniref:Retrovirus-related Pol polyprotein from transposon TNT 1-94-like beta-barrel domain-containing protein n=1 Tax=Puccinia coronata f. sp. avenae TaxID=200324 RepID=A0A2N5TJ41_9BASI|nr:hypothetical protein PCASD_25228 [Puccinia coronata f. sp. avenae]
MIACNVAGFRRALSANAFRENCCFLDSGASHHMFSDRSCFEDYHKRTTLIELADGNNLKSTGKGQVQIFTENSSSITLKALHVPELADGAVAFSAEIIGGTCNVKLEPTPQELPDIQAPRL